MPLMTDLLTDFIVAILAPVYVLVVHLKKESETIQEIDLKNSHLIETNNHLPHAQGICQKRVFSRLSIA